MKKIYTTILVVLISFLFSSPVLAAGTATITASPATGTYKVGDTFNVDVVVDGGGVTFNAAQSNVCLNSNIIIKSVTPKDCNFAFVSTPSASNLNFAGAMLAASSNKCSVYTLGLQAAAAGTGTLSFSHEQVKSAKDSSELFSSATDGSYTITGSSSTVTPISNPCPSTIAYVGNTVHHGVVATNTSSTSVDNGWMDLIIVLLGALLFIVGLLGVLLVVYTYLPIPKPPFISHLFNWLLGLSWTKTPRSSNPEKV